MPLFDQICDSCGHRFEHLVIPGKDTSAPRPCPRCHAADTTQQASPSMFKIAAPKFDIKRGRGHNPYENLTLHHIHDGVDANGRPKPLRVNSEAELHAAEKRLGFTHAASWGLENSAPQHDPGAGDITRGYKKKFNLDPEAYKPENNRDVTAGMVQADTDTLAYKPNSTKEVGA